jgi:AraC family transcriptional regulator of adaptative response/methylated-DNA-[protein]-cysteine methyltransferase
MPPRPTHASGHAVTEPQAAGTFATHAGFVAALTRVLGAPPADPAERSPLAAHAIATPLGPLLAIADPAALHLLEFFDRKALPTELRHLQARLHAPIALGRPAPIDQIEQDLIAYFAGAPNPFATPLALHATPFTRAVWAALRAIPSGQTRAYHQIAAALGRPAATRAVARANGANQLAIVIPCHRLVGADGDLTGYGGGLWRKRWLIGHEQSRAAPAA